MKNMHLPVEYYQVTDRFHQKNSNVESGSMPVRPNERYNVFLRCYDYQSIFIFHSARLKQNGLK